MRYLALAWRVSTWWMRAVAILVLILILKMIGEWLWTDKNAMQTPAPVAIAGPQRDDNALIERCEAAVMAVATNRSSVKFSHPNPLPRVSNAEGGGFIVNTKFRAINAFGAESVSLARCEIASDGRQLIDFAVTDSR